MANPKTPRPSRRTTPNPNSPSRRPLPAPTASEAAFERLLDAFESGDDDAKDGVAALAGLSCVAEPAFLDELYARKSEFLERDRFSSIGDANEFYTKIVGVSFEGRQNVVAGLVEGSSLELVREPHNAFDPSAIAVRFGALQLGFIKREIARRLAPNIDAGESYAAVVASVTGGGAKHIGVNLFVRRRGRAATRVARDSSPREAASHDALRTALIGDRPLRDAQREVLVRIDAGRNTLAILGTGRGKSVCFQLPAAIRALERGEKTLVLYPLRALANDQFEAFTKRLSSFGLRILRANGAIDSRERADLDAALEDGSWDVVLSTPEFATFHRSAFERAHNRPALLVIDEAHHVHESKHRAAYGVLGDFVRSLGSPQILALTATAGDDAFATLRRTLAIDAWTIDPSVRENLRVADARNAGDKNAYLARELEGDGKAIVYCNSRSEATKLAERLRAIFGSVAFYHAGVPSPERARVEDAFRSGDVRIIVATSAFGEGIDLPDVRDVVLYHLNFNFTEFNQMAGRAGRDGAHARIHLLYGDADRRINDYLIARDAPSLGTLRELYRALRGLTTGDVVRITHEDIARTLELENVEASTVGVAVRIFEEAGLVKTGIDDDGRFIRFLTVASKVDLATTPRFAEAQADREAFERFCELALTADATTLEHVINRPIYPDRVALLGG